MLQQDDHPPALAAIPVAAAVTAVAISTSTSAELMADIRSHRRPLLHVAAIAATVPVVINAVAPVARDVPAVALVAAAVPAIAAAAATMLVPPAPPARRTPSPPPTPLPPIVLPAVVAAAAVVAAVGNPEVAAAATAAAAAATAAALAATALALASSDSSGSESDGGGEEHLDVARWLAEGATTLAAKAAPKVRHEGRNAAQKKEAQARSAALSTTADTTGVSFRGRAFQKLYFETKYARRGQLVHDVLARLLGDRSSADARTVRHLLRAELTAKRSGKPQLTVCSVGGGPGTDAAGVVAANALLLGFLPAAAQAAVSTAESALSDIAASYRVARKIAADTQAASALAEKRRAAHGRRAASRRAEVDAAAGASATAAAAAAANGDGSATAKQREATGRAAVKALGTLERARETAAAADECLARSEVAADAAGAAADAAATAERASKKALVSGRRRAADAAAATPDTPGGGVGGGERERARLHISLLDFEPQWGAYEPTLAELFRPLHATVDFSTCDVCAPLSEVEAPLKAAAMTTRWAANRSAAAKLHGADLLVFAYVCHETSRAAALSGHAFYCDLAVGAQPGALLLFADVQGRSASALAAVHAAMEGAVAARGAGRRIARVPLDPGVEASLRSDLMLLHVSR